MPLTWLNYQERSFKEYIVTSYTQDKQVQDTSGAKRTAPYIQVYLRNDAIQSCHKTKTRKKMFEGRTGTFLDSSRLVFVNIFHNLSEILLIPRKVTFQFKYKFQKALKSYDFLTSHVSDTGPPLLLLVKESKPHWTKVHLKRDHLAHVQNSGSLLD